MSRVTPESRGHVRAADEADDATRGSAIKLAAEIGSRLVLLATTLLLAHGLVLEEYGAYGRLAAYALLLAELAELGLQLTATRALVAGTLSLRALVRARIALFSVFAVVVLGAAVLVGAGPRSSRLQPLVLALLVFYFALSGWGEFLGVALRCRGARRHEALVLLVLRAAGLLLVTVVLAGGGGLTTVAWGLALSPLPALALGAWLLRRTAAVAPAPEASVTAVLLASAPLAIYSGLLLLSPRVEFIVFSVLRDDGATGLFFAAIQVLWFLTMMPAAITAGAMPALTREALTGGTTVRRRTSATLALLAAPAGVGLLLVAPGVLGLLFGSTYEPAAASLRVLGLAVVPVFMNALLSWSLIAAGRPSWPPWLTATRVAAAFVLSLTLIPRFGAPGAAAGLVLAECLLLLLGGRACAAAGFAVPVTPAIAAALVATVPMALAVWGVRHNLVLALAVGVLTYAATLAAGWHFLPELAGRLLGSGSPGVPGRETSA
jgi:O-antigen/teichoic acid export membrane protein